MRLTASLFILLLSSALASVLAPDLLALDRGALAQGELWRLWTGHLVHWNVEHFVWNGLTFVVLAWLLGRLAARILVVLLTAAAPLISGAVLAAEPSLQIYGGLSGLDVALWVAVCMAVIIKSRDSATWKLAWLALFAGVLKVAFEWTTGSAALVGGSLLFVPASHLAGAILGILAAVLAPASRRGRFTVPEVA